jgi:hypothetical protein
LINSSFSTTRRGQHHELRTAAKGSEPVRNQTRVSALGVVLGERHRHDEWHEAAPALVDRLDQLGPVVRREVAPEVAGQVLEDVRVPPARRAHDERLHEQRVVDPDAEEPA